MRDRFSAAYLVAVAARAVQDVGELRALAEKAGRRLSTLTLETEVRFASAEARAGFAEELARAVARLTGKYHDAKAPGRAGVSVRGRRLPGDVAEGVTRWPGRERGR